MKHMYTKSQISLLMVLFFSVSVFAQNGKSIWTKSTQQKAKSETPIFRKTEPIKSEFYQLDVNTLKSILQNAPRRSDVGITSNVVVDFPTADGKFESFRVMEAPVMHPLLQAQHPDIRSYVGQSVDNPSTMIRFSITPQGLNTMMFSDSGTQLIDPYSKNGNLYIVYKKRSLPSLDDSFLCDVIDDASRVGTVDPNFDLEAARNANDGQLRTYDLALACTIEYSAFHVTAAGVGAGTLAQKKAAVLAAMNVTMTRVNGLYERELSVTMVIVPNNANIIFIDSDTFDNANANTLINQSQSVIDGAIGTANYDIGHTFSTGGGGLAQVNSPCVAGSKARGITGLPAPVGDAYDIDFVAHEMGHQYGSSHTFNGDAGNCAGGNRSGTNAYEPGSGTTIMAYAGICAPQNVQNNSDDYFHQRSLVTIWANIFSGNSSTCPTLSSTGNAAPTAEAGANYTIPISTPYILTASSTDADGIGSHTYTWEQYDLGPAGIPIETTATGPLVRSYTGTTNPTRYVPNIPDLIATGGSTTWEKLVSINRAINYVVTVRDNDARGGQTAVDNMTITTSTTSGPFVVTSQNTSVTWSQGNTETVTWNVAGTNGGSVNTPNVDILLSTNGGESFDTVLATAIPNDGSHDIIVPNVLAENCRIMVKGSGNIFFNINIARIAIGYNIAPGEECTTYVFNVNQSLTNNATQFESFFFDVNDSGTMTDVNVKYDISTTTVAPLHMAMISPGGTRSYLYVANSCTTGSNMQATFDDESGTPIVCGTNPITGLATTAAIGTPEPLTAIYGQEMLGSWRFMTANVSANTMTFNTIDLELCKSGFVSVLAPTRVNQSVIQVAVVSSVTMLESHLKVTSPNTANTSDIQYTLKVLPTKGTLYLNGAALVLNSTFTQTDVASGIVTYTTTSTADDSDSFRVDVNDNNGGTLPNLLVNIQILENLGVDDFNFDNSFVVYPNPNNGEFTVKLRSNTNNDIKVQVFDIRGRSIFDNSYYSASEFNKTINLSNVQSGIYLVKVSDGNKQSTKKIIVN